MIPFRCSRRCAAVALTLLGLAFLAGACAPAAVHTELVVAGTDDARTVTAFSFATDSFAFPNEIRSRHPDEPGLYANYCFVMARALRQFFLGARFDPDAPRLDHDGYVARVHAIASRAPWLPPLPLAERVAIPGYANLKAFSRAEEGAVKEGLGGRFWTMVHWTNWRVTFRVSREHQAQVARDIVAELRRGRLAQLLVTNWPKPELNHTVVAFAYESDAEGLRLSVWDPNDPSEPGLITFDQTVGRFQATRVYDTEPGPIRVFRMYYSWLL